MHCLLGSNNITPVQDRRSIYWIRLPSGFLMKIET